MKKVYSLAEIRAAEERAIAQGTPSLVLMERAGAQLAETVLQVCKKRKSSDVLFVCGGGGNGGDGFCAAELVRKKVETSALCLAEKFSPDCQAMRSRFQGEIFNRIPRRRFSLVVDCLMGAGMRETPQGSAKELIDFINSCADYVISCDLPAGLSECGVGRNPRVKANLTLSVGGIKQALLLADGADVSGEIFSSQIGIFPEGGAEVWEEGDVCAFFPERRSHVHKGSFGCAAILAEECEFPNAPLFSARACLKSGVGYTKLFAGEPLFSASIGQNAAMLQKFDGLTEPMRANAIALGMGAGNPQRLHDEIKYLLNNFEGVLILDADAINACARFGYEFFRKKKCRVILTPHIGEFARLIGKSAEEILQNALSLSREFAEEYGLVLILKNNRSIITDGTRTAINTTGCSSLSKGGSGDILTGFLAGTCARGIEPFEAACVASYILGRAGEEASARKGDYGATPFDVIENLPNAIMGLRRAEKAHADREEE